MWASTANKSKIFNVLEGEGIKKKLKLTQVKNSRVNRYLGWHKAESQ